VSRAQRGRCLQQQTHLAHRQRPPFDARKATHVKPIYRPVMSRSRQQAPITANANLQTRKRLPWGCLGLSSRPDRMVVSIINERYQAQKKEKEQRRLLLTPATAALGILRQGALTSVRSGFKHFTGTCSIPPVLYRLFQTERSVPHQMLRVGKG
jgi:hypothetical protein